MMCAWKELLAVLPPRLRPEVDRLGREDCRELRLRLGRPPELCLGEKSVWLRGETGREELDYVVNAASRYSPWAAVSAARGYLTAPGGHRIGLCGEAVDRGGRTDGLRLVTSLCIRVARDFPGVGKDAPMEGSVLILGPPGWGKTTLLRDMARIRAEREETVVVDEREELFPRGYARGDKMDVLTGCPKSVGIGMVLRTMGPGCIAVDEITEAADAQALIQAANCGVSLLATAHASGLEDLRRRSVYRPLVEGKLFDSCVILHRDKSCHVERMWV